MKEAIEDKYPGDYISSEGLPKSNIKKRFHKVQTVKG